MGREFIELFEQWAASYNQSVSGEDEEYKEVFEDYDHILEAVASRSYGTVIEFGVGTGNLTEKLIRFGRKVYGIEPSKAMREIAKERYPDLILLDGDFLQFPKIPEPVDSIVSTYAFHHLTDEEKNLAIQNYSHLLEKNGKIIFADTAFRDEEDRNQLHEYVKKQGYRHLLQDLEREYYTTIGTLDEIFRKNNFEVSFKKLNRYVWLIDATKN